MKLKEQTKRRESEHFSFRAKRNELRQVISLQLSRLPQPDQKLTQLSHLAQLLLFGPDVVVQRTISRLCFGKCSKQLQIRLQKHDGNEQQRKSGGLNMTET